MKSSGTNGLRWILALALLTGGACARAQSTSISSANSPQNSRAFRAGTGVRKESADSQQETPAQAPAPASARQPIPTPPTKTAEAPGPTVTAVRIVDESGKVLVESPT